MTHLIWFLVGFTLGAWASLYACNRYYRNEIWDRTKKLRLMKFDVEEAKLNAEIAKHDLKVDQMLNERMK